MKKSELEKIRETSAADMAEKYGLPFEQASVLLEKAMISGEISDVSGSGIFEWIKNRFEPNMFRIGEEEYLHISINALKIQHLIAGTDYGSSRQRDFGQKWSDTIRGYIGEFGFKKVLMARWGIDCSLGHEEGPLEEFLPMDIHKVKKPGEVSYRDPRIRISIKTAKFNGIWFDIPGDQFSHSEIHALTKIGVETDHLFGFFKSISVFRDKILKKGTESHLISQMEADKIFTKLPVFAPIIGYTAGFAVRDRDYSRLNYSGKKGRINFKITGWNGHYNPSDLDDIKRYEGISGKVTFEGIGEFTPHERYLFNSGSLFWKEEDWNKVIDKL